MFVFRAFERRRRNALLANRVALSDEDVFTLYYQDSMIEREPVLAAWQMTAGTLHVPPGKLRPDDPVERLLGVPGWLPELSLDVDDLGYICAARSELTRLNPGKVLETIDDVVRHLAGEMNNAGTRINRADP